MQHDIITLPNHMISIDEMNPEIKSCTIYTLEGYVILDSMFQTKLMDKIIDGAEYLLFDYTPMKIDFPMTNTLYHYTLYGNITYTKLFNIFLRRENISNGEDTEIFKDQMDEFELSCIVGDLIKVMRYN